jgi:CRP-like cAMP-binding protein/CheY-like chemotaxis protein
VHEQGKLLYEEGEDVKQYSIILMGRCRLRCARPAPTRGELLRASVSSESEPTDEELIANGALDSDGMVPLGEVHRGESLGMFPGDKSSCYEITSLEKTVLLQLDKRDYESSLGPFQRQVDAEVVAFLESHRLCPQASMTNLSWLSRHMKHRSVLKGNTIMHAGDPQRNLWFLRAGSCSVLMDTDVAKDVAEHGLKGSGEDDVPEDDASEEEEEGEDPVRQSRMRTMSRGAKQQNQKAAEDKRNRLISKYAHGRMRDLLEGSHRPVRDLGGIASGKTGVIRSAAILSEPGIMLGEEILLFDTKDHVAARCSYSIKATQDCHFYVADFTTWRQLALFMGSDALAGCVHDQLQRRSKLVSKTEVVSRRLHNRKRMIQQAELNKEECRRFRMPCSADGDGPLLIEDPEEYLQVVFDHRRGPQDEKNLPTLSALDGTKLGPGCPHNGPAVNKMLKIISHSGNISSKKYCENLRRIRMAPKRRVSTSHTANPMGEYLSPKAVTHYESESLDPLKMLTLQLQKDPSMLGDISRVSSQPSLPTSNIFQHTELDVELTLGQSSSVPMLPKVCGTDDRNISSAPAGATSLEDMLPHTELQLPRETSWSPALGRPHTSGAIKDNDGTLAGNSSADRPARILMSRSSRSSASDRQAKVMKAFSRAVAKKSVLVLTDRADVRKTIMRSVLAAEIDVCFAKSSTATWQKLQQPKETFHALIWDLAKSEVAVDELLKNIRMHDRYSRLPVIVLSAEHELSQTVRVACSFVVFHPVVPAMLREALLWCFDRRSLTGLASEHKAATSSAFDEFVLAPGSTVNAWGPQ